MDDWERDACYSCIFLCAPIFDGVVADVDAPAEEVGAHVCDYEALGVWVLGREERGRKERIQLLLVLLSQ